MFDLYLEVDIIKSRLKTLKKKQLMSTKYMEEAVDILRSA